MKENCTLDLLLTSLNYFGCDATKRGSWQVARAPLLKSLLEHGSLGIQTLTEWESTASSHWENEFESLMEVLKNIHNWVPLLYPHEPLGDSDYEVWDGAGGTIFFKDSWTDAQLCLKNHWCGLMCEKTMNTINITPKLIASRHTMLSFTEVP